MKRSVKRGMRSGLCAVLMAAMVVSVSADTTSVRAKKVSKQESVYVNAASDGSVDEITVADWLKDADKVSGGLSDKSDLKEITNTKGDETFSQSGDELSWDTAGDDIYYQGKSDKQLPVAVKITYELDGKEVDPASIVGQSGKLKISVNYENKSKVTKKIDGEDVEIYTPFLMVTGMILSGDHFLDVKVDGNSKVVNDGSNNIVVGMAVPGLKESLDLSGEAKDKIDDKLQDGFSISCDTKEFEMKTTFTYASSAILNDLDLDDDIDVDELEDKLDDVEDATDKLVDGADKLSDGTGSLSKGLKQFTSGLKKYDKSGVKKIRAGMATFAKSTPKLTKGVKKYAKGAASLAKGTKQYASGAAAIASGNKELYNSVKDLPSSVKELSDGVKSYTEGVDKLADKDTATALKSGSKSVADGIGTLNENLTRLKESFANNEKLIAGLKATKADETLIAQLETVTATQKASIEALESATGSDSDLAKGATQVAGGISQVMDGASKLSENSSALTGGMKKLNEGMSSLTEGAKKLKEGGETLTANNKTLTNGADGIITASGTLGKQIGKVGKGVKQLNTGVKALDSATGELLNGADKLQTGAKKLDKGMDSLANGVDKFSKKAIKKILDTYDDDIKGLVDRVKAIADVGKEYKNFSGISDDMDGEVKFIIETKEVKGDDE